MICNKTLRGGAEAKNLPAELPDDTSEEATPTVEIGVMLEAHILSIPMDDPVHGETLTNVTMTNDALRQYILDHGTDTGRTIDSLQERNKRQAC